MIKYIKKQKIRQISSVLIFGNSR